MIIRPKKITSEAARPVEIPATAVRSCLFIRRLESGLDIVRPLKRAQLFISEGEIQPAAWDRPDPDQPYVTPGNSKFPDGLLQIIVQIEPVEDKGPLLISIFRPGRRTLAKGRERKHYYQ